MFILKKTIHVSVTLKMNDFSVHSCSLEVIVFLPDSFSPPWHMSFSSSFMKGLWLESFPESLNAYHMYFESHVNNNNLAAVSVGSGCYDKLP